MGKQLILKSGQHKELQEFQEMVNSKPIALFIQTVDGKNQIMDLIQTTYTSQPAINGFPDKLDERETGLLFAGIFDVIKRHGHMRLPELKHIFAHGMVGEYGDMTHFFNAKNVNLWIQRYHESFRYKQAKELAQLRHQEPKPEPTEEEKLQIREENWHNLQEWIRREHGHLKEIVKGKKATFKDISDHPAAAYAYDVLLERGLLQEPPKREKIEAMTMYLADAVAQLRRGGYRPPGGGMVEIKDPTVQSRARTMAKGHFVKKCVFEWFINDLSLDVIFSQ